MKMCLHVAVSLLGTEFCFDVKLINIWLQIQDKKSQVFCFVVLFCFSNAHTEPLTFLL